MDRGQFVRSNYHGKEGDLEASLRILKDNRKMREDMDVESALDEVENESMPPAQAKEAAVNPYNTDLGFLYWF